MRRKGIGHPRPVRLGVDKTAFAALAGQVSSARILVVDDDAGIRYTLRGILEDAGFDVDEAPEGASALARLDAVPADLVITDLRMPGMDGMTLLGHITARGAGPRVIVITAHGSERLAVDAMKAGAHDYFRKPFENDELLAVVQRATETVRLQRDNERLRSELNLSRSLVFASPTMSRLALLVERVAPRDVTVLITGESGTGKERVAEAIVRASSRASRPFVRFNCAALARDLAEAELFGHSKGAFTGAHRERAGLFREADGGTILLDEVGELDPGTQARLLRVLQEREVRPVGEDSPVKIDVRILAATHRDLRQLVEAGAFREDLYYRLKVVTLQIPALREHKEDIPVLARHFFATYAERFGAGPLRIPDTLMERLISYDWPGNVRELENAIESLVALSVGGELDVSLLPGLRPAPSELTLKQRVDAYERGIVVEALEAARGNRSEAARRLGISRVTLHDKLKKYGLSDSETL